MASIHLSMFMAACKHVGLVSRAAWLQSIASPVEGDGRYDDQRSFRKTTFEGVKQRVACSKSEHVPIGVDHHVDKVRIVERIGGPFKGRFLEAPIRGPLPPKQQAEFTTVSR